MNNYPIHGVVKYDTLSLEDLTVGKNLNFHNSNYRMPIVESYRSADGGKSSYAVVRMGDLSNGDPKYVAFTNDRDLEQKLNKRMQETMERSREIRKNNAQNQAVSSQSTSTQKAKKNQIPTIEECMAVRYAQKPVSLISGPDINNVFCVNTNTYVHKEDMRPEMTYQIDCNVVNMRGMNRAPIFSGTLSFTISHIDRADGKMIIEPYADAKLLNNNGSVIANVNSVLSNFDFSKDLQLKTDMCMEMGASAWGDYHHRFFNQMQQGLDKHLEHVELDEISHSGR